MHALKVKDLFKQTVFTEDLPVNAQGLTLIQLAQSI